MAVILFVSYTCFFSLFLFDKIQGISQQHFAAQRKKKAHFLSPIQLLARSNATGDLVESQIDFGCLNIHLYAKVFHE